jgi:excisionase family DNA binding protein
MKEKIMTADAVEQIEEAPRLLLTVNQAAARLGIGRTLCYDLIASGALRTVHVGRLHRVPADELVAFVDRLSRGPGPHRTR